LDGDLKHRQVWIAAAMDAAEFDPWFNRIAGSDWDWFGQFGSRPRLVGCRAVQRAVGPMVVVPVAIVVETALKV
jgi:hypothetical protein